LQGIIQINLSSTLAASVGFALLGITQAELGSALAYRKNYLISHSL
jgi:hypothetical protein